MPTQTASSKVATGEPAEIRVKLAYSGEVYITYIPPALEVEALEHEIRAICKFDPTQVFTVKWVDEEGDPCTISSQQELDEALRLYDLNKDSELAIHGKQTCGWCQTNAGQVFPNVPEPGMPCQGEDRSIYRRGARRWRKLYKVNGHIFQAKRFNRRAFCEFCKDRIWGLGRQGFKCTQCKLLVHKKCHKLQKVPCNADLDTSTDTLASHDSSTLPRPGTNGRMAMQEFAGEISDPGITEETPVEMPAITGQSSEPLSPAGQAGQYCLEDFELIRVIGRGSYAKVLMVELKKTKRIYAMKVIKKTLVTDDEDIDWVQTEKHVFETASNHPFLVGLHSCFQTPSRLFFVIEFVRGGDLMFHMQRQRRLPEEHARFYAAEICLALNFLHEKGIIYRDLKLDNVLLDHEGHIKLTDYGMCKEGIRPGDTTSTFCGTPNYIAPEILQGVEYSFSVDWWALGVLLYEMLAGKSPFDIVGASDNPDCNTEDFLFQVILERPIRIPRSLSVKAASILKGFLNKNPVDRLGCHPETGFTDIITHPFFKTIIWEMLEQRQVPPPYRPRLESDRDLANFPPEFTDEPIQLTPDDARAIENIDQSEFEGFEYVNPLLMSMEDCV
ncbi:atypical protein kinase C isoform X3 [Panulirus ornatus]|uniref:atypical protein kinase C isoform X3 n=1 Tax=Panulirus ornatus TaxID=150431 RepID=UPI003A84261B